MATAVKVQPNQPAYSAAFDVEDGLKRHAACDECRKRKLKCSGEPTGCSRCVKQKLVCHYSEQKQMGRPRKKQKTSKEDTEQIQPSQEEVVLKKQRFAHITDPGDRGTFEAICPGPVAQYIKNYTAPPSQPFMTAGPLDKHRSDSLTSEGTPPSYGPTTPPSNLMFESIYPTDVALWPDYSTMLSLPIVVQESHEKDPRSRHDEPQSQAHSTTSLDSLATLPPTPPALAYQTST